MDKQFVIRELAMAKVRRDMKEDFDDPRISEVLITSIYHEFLNERELEAIVEYRGNVIEMLSNMTTGTQGLLWQVQNILDTLNEVR